jgi:hypothetical protein
MIFIVDDLLKSLELLAAGYELKKIAQGSNSWLTAYFI